MTIRKINLLPPTLLLALSALFSRLLGLVRDHLLARTFGASTGIGIFDLDVYYAAFRIPDLIYNLLVIGTISAAFIPIFTQYKKLGQLKDAWEFASSMMHLMMIGILTLSGLIYVFAPYLAHLVAGGFTPEQLELTAKLMRILLLSPILFSIASIFISIQDSFKTFFFRSLAPLFYNAGIIIGILYFSVEFGVIGVTWGVVLGALLQLVIQLPVLKLIGYKHVWMLGVQRADVWRAFKLIIPRVVGLSVTQLTLLVNTLIASFLATGSITIFYLADNFQALPLGMIGISFAITSFATLSELATEKTTKPFAKEISKVMGQILFLVIPATVGMLVLRTEIISTLLEYGKFTAEDTLLMAQVMGFLLISLFAQSLIPLLGRGFYAFHNTKTPVVAGIIGSALSIIGSYLLGIRLEYGIVGIAIAFSLGAILNAGLLAHLMQAHLKQRLFDWLNIVKMIGLSLVMGGVVFLLKNSLPYEGPFLYQISLLVGYTLVGILVYFALAHTFRLRELEVALKRFRRD